MRSFLTITYGFGRSATLIQRFGRSDEDAFGRIFFALVGP